MQLLAESNIAVWVGIGVGVFDTLFSAAITLGLYKVSIVVDRHDKQEKQSEQVISTLKNNLHETATKLIDERMRAITHELRGHVQGLVNTIDDIKGRLQDGDGTFGELATADHKIELQVVQKIGLLREWMLETFAGKTDLAAHEASMSRRVENMDSHIRDVQTKVAVIDARANANAATNLTRKAQ
jgi:hypothetical protein